MNDLTLKDLRQAMEQIRGLTPDYICITDDVRKHIEEEYGWMKEEFIWRLSQIREAIAQPNLIVVAP